MEIVQPLDLSDQQKYELEMHSVLNILNILNHHLFKLANGLGKIEEVSSSLDAVQELSALTQFPEREEEFYHSIAEQKDALLSNVENTLSAHPQKQSHPELLKTANTITSIIRILEIRIKELADRKKIGSSWIPHSIEQLHINFKEVFAAIVQSSNAHFRIVTNPAQQGPSDYLVRLHITGLSEQEIRMPAIIQDVLRDLLANARKYTPTGGAITALLREETERLYLQVNDNGRGIPDDELDAIINFGRRGRNTQDIPSYGGGFGLTKAYFVTRQYGGRMWIESEIGKGTTITISIPRPK